MGLILKSPLERIDHVIDWSGELAGAAIAVSLWSVDPVEEGSMTVEDSDVATAVVQVRLSGGIVGRLYRVTNQVRLADGQVRQRSISVRVEEQ